MSWDKNTVVTSDISTRIEMLDEMGRPYVLCERGPVRDSGLNSEHDHPWIQLRSLQYGTVMIWEQMQRLEDCDADDHVVSINGKVGDKEPPLEITLHAWQDDGTCYDCGRTKEEINNNDDETDMQDRG